MKEIVAKALSLGTGRVHSLGIFLTRRCNGRCPYCCLDVGSDPSDKLTLEELKRVVAEASALGVRQLVIPGEGEPLLDENLVPLVAYAGALRLGTKVYTNGALVTASMAEKLFHMDVSVVCKLPTLDEGLFNQLSGVRNLMAWAEAPLSRRDGSAVRIPVGLLRLLEAGYGTKRGRRLLSVACVVMRPNLEDIPDVARLCRSLGLEFLPETTIPVGSAARAWEALSVTLAEESRLFEELVRICGRRFLWQQRVRCRFETNPFIDASGNLRHCFALAAKVGNVRDTPLAELHAREMRLRSATDMLSPKLSLRHRGFRKCVTRRTLESRRLG